MDTSEAKLGGYLFFPVSYSWYLMMFARPEFLFLLCLLTKTNKCVDFIHVSETAKVSIQKRNLSSARGRKLYYLLILTVLYTH